MATNGGLADERFSGLCRGDRGEEERFCIEVLTGPSSPLGPRLPLADGLVMQTDAVFNFGVGVFSPGGMSWTFPAVLRLALPDFRSS